MAASRQGPRQRIARGNRRRQPHRMPERSGLEIQIRAECRERTAQLQHPGLARFTPREVHHARRSRIRCQIDRRTKLPGERVHLEPDISERGDRRIGTGAAHTELLSLIVQFAQFPKMSAWRPDRMLESLAESRQNRRGNFERAIENFQFARAPRLALDPDPQPRERHQTHADAFGLAQACIGSARFRPIRCVLTKRAHSAPDCSAPSPAAPP